MGKQKYNTETLIEAIKKVHGDIYGFDKLEYKGYKEKITLYCKEHDIYFENTIGHILNGQGCPKCRYIKSAANKRRTLEEVINEAKKIHGDKYDYSLITEYKNDRINYPIICKKHNLVFKQSFNNHIKGKQGCPICGREKNSIARIMPFETFVDIANKIHNNRYQYVEDGYTGAEGIITYICPKHGIITQDASNHIHLGQGCPQCNFTHSKAEDEIYDFIISCVGEEKVKQHERKTLDNKAEIDIFIPHLKLGIEYNGLYWHSEANKIPNYHLEKTKMCNEKGIHLFHIFEDEWRDKKEIVKSMLKNQLNLTEDKLYARKCEIKEVDINTSKIFLNNNHLQGYCPSSVRLGLFYNGELVSLMTFGPSRHFIGHNDKKWELIRFCNKLNKNVIGGASKLFKYFLNLNISNEIVSYADKRWSDGKLYDVLGFVKYNESKPNYYYIINGKREYRFNLRKQILMEKYNCPKDKTEKMFCKEMNWYRIYDCGCLCYKWENK